MTYLRTDKSLTETLLGYKRQIEAALRYADHSHTFDDIVRGVLTGKLLFAPVSEETCGVFEVYTYPAFKTLHIFLAAGDIDEIIRFTPILLADAEKLGCDRITFTGRKGFARVLSKHGWRERAVQMELLIPAESKSDLG